MSILLPKSVVLTGGPCCGKTTLIERLFQMGMTVVSEIAREVIEESRYKGTDLVPEKRPKEFQEEVAMRQLEKESMVVASKGHNHHFFLDRGLIDGAGYNLAAGIPINRFVADSARSRYGVVVILDPLPNYEVDEARMEDQKQAVKIHASINEAYHIFGYTPLCLPVLPIDERVKLLLKMSYEVIEKNVVAALPPDRQRAFYDIRL